MAFNIITNPEFRAFIIYLNSQVEEFLAKGAFSVKRWVMRQYHSLKLFTVILVLRKARTKIHISCDLWTSLNLKAILGITTQFINEGGILQSLILGIKEVVREHTGENIAQYVIKVLKDYKIIHNLGYFTIDNALDNDMIITTLSLIL